MNADIFMWVAWNEARGAFFLHESSYTAWLNHNDFTKEIFPYFIENDSHSQNYRLPD